MNIIKNKLFLFTLLILGLVGLFTFPALLHLNTLLIGNGGDNYENFSFQYLAAQNMLHGHWPFDPTNLFRYPVGFNFGAGYESVVTVLTGAFLSLVINNILAHNITVLIMYFLNGLASFLLFRKLSKSNILGFIGSIIYGFSFFVIARSAGHLNLFFIAGLVFAIYSVLRLIENFNLKNALLFYSSATLIVLGSFLYTDEFLISLLISLPLLLIFYKSEIVKLIVEAFNHKLKLALLAIPFITIVLVFSFPHLQAFVTHDYYKPDRSSLESMTSVTPALTDFILPNNFLPLQITRLNLSHNFIGIDQVVFLGWIELLVFIFFLIFYKNLKQKLFVLLGALLFFILTLGYLIPKTNLYLPYYYLHKLPLFSLMDEPSRFYPLMYLFLTTGVVLILKQWNRPNIKTALLFILLISILIVERLPHNYWLTPTFQDQNWVKIVRQQSSKAVLDLPVSYSNSAYHLLPYLYGKPTVTGTFQWFADTPKAKAFITKNDLTRFMCGDAYDLNSDTINQNNKLIELLKNYGITTIIVHKNDSTFATKFYFSECSKMRMQTTYLLPQLMMPNPNAQTQVINLFFPSTPGLGDIITFPADGSFAIQGLAGYPNNWLPLHLFLNNQEVNLSQDWIDKGNQISTLNPNLILSVHKGDKLRFEFNQGQNTAYSFIQLWYTYTAPQMHQFDIVNGAEKIYEDNEAAVFTIK